jgi:hypothetical protein
MTYTRVLPRDLFNEGDLLNCLGRLWIALDERRDHHAKLIPDVVKGPFVIEQEPSDGSIYAEHVLLIVAGLQCPLFRPLNARGKWPLWARFGPLEGGYEDVRVFDLDGNLSAEFWLAITEGKA